MKTFLKNGIDCISAYTTQLQCVEHYEKFFSKREVS